MLPARLGRRSLGGGAWTIEDVEGEAKDVEKGDTVLEVGGTAKPLVHGACWCTCAVQVCSL